MSKLGIPYENEGPIALYRNGAMTVTMDGIRPLPEVEAIETIMDWTYELELGGVMPPIVAVIEGV